MAFASSRETLYLISVSTRLGYLDAEAERSLEKLGDRVAAALYALRLAVEQLP